MIKGDVYTTWQCYSHYQSSENDMQMSWASIGAEKVLMNQIVIEMMKALKGSVARRFGARFFCAITLYLSDSWNTTCLDIVNQFLVIVLFLSEKFDTIAWVDNISTVSDAVMKSSEPTLTKYRGVFYSWVDHLSRVLDFCRCISLWSDISSRHRIDLYGMFWSAHWVLV